MKQYPAIYSAFFNSPHCILPEKASAIAAFLELKQAGGSVTGDELAVIVGESRQPEPYAIDSHTGTEYEGEAMQAAAKNSAPGRMIAVVPIFGTLTQHGIGMEDSGKTSTREIGNQIAQAVAAPGIGTILLHVNSPGGQVFGTQELSDQIFAARTAKRIVASIDSMAASAALWIATAADEVNITPGGEAGSHGVVTMHQDVSQAEAAMGVKTTLIATPAKKIEGNPFEPLSDETLSEIQQRNQVVFDRFTDALARNSGVSRSHVLENFGGGGMLFADEAKAAGMADRVEPFSATLDRLAGGGRIQRNRHRAAAARLALDAAESGQLDKNIACR